MKILCLSVHYGHKPEWTRQTTQIQDIDPAWKGRTLLQQAFFLTRVAKQYDRFLCFYETHLVILLWLLCLVRFRTNIGGKIIFVTLLYDVSLLQHIRWWTGYGLRKLLRKQVLMLFVRIPRKIVVHTEAERGIYARMFGVSVDRFVFIPYYIYEGGEGKQTGASDRGEYVIAAGRGRDFKTYIEAMTNLPYHSVIIAGKADQPIIAQRAIPALMDVYIEVSTTDYHRLVANAAVAVIPIGANMPLRSLGQIAAFEAARHAIPVIAARTFHMTDYFNESEMLFYDPGDSQALRRAVIQLMDDNTLRTQYGQRIAVRVQTHYTIDHFLDRLLAFINSI